MTFSVSFSLLANKIFKTLNVQKKFLVLFVTTITSQLLKSNKVDKIYKNVSLCAWKITRLFYIMLLFPHCYVPLFPLKCSSSTRSRLTLKKRTVGNATTYICTGVNTAKNNSLNGSLRVAFDLEIQFEFLTSCVRFL